MESDPLRLVFRTVPGLHMVAFGLLAVCGALLLVGLDLVRVVIDEMIAPGAGSATLLRLAIALPPSVGEPPLVLMHGWSLDAAARGGSLLPGLALVPILMGAILTLVHFLAARIGTRVVARLRGMILEGVLAARFSAQHDAETAAGLAGEALAQESAVFGSALVALLQFGGLCGLALLYVATVDGALVLPVLALVLLVAIVGLQRLGLRLSVHAALRREGRGIARSLAELLRRRSAVRAHGTVVRERERFRRDFARQHRRVDRTARRLALATSLSGTLRLLTPLTVLGLGAWLGAGRLTAGALVAAAAASALAALAARELTRWRLAVDHARGWLAAAAPPLSALRPRDRKEATSVLPRGGALIAAGVSAYDRVSGGRISGIDCTIHFPAHVALVGEDEGPRIFAALVGGKLDPSMGRLTFGGIDLAAVDPVERARRIAYAGSEPILVPGSLRENLLYGTGDPGAGNTALADLDARLTGAIAVAGLDGFIHGRGLAGFLDPQREVKLTAAIVDSRRAVRTALRAESLDNLVDPFDAGRFNRHATIGENLLFGEPVGDTFREEALASHPYVRALLEAVELTKPLAAIGLSIAASMIEMFADIPAGHPLFERFSFYSAGEQGYFEDLVERRAGRSRSRLERDRSQLIGLALRYNESRHRLGLVDEALEQRIVAARADFAKLLPAGLQPAIEFYDAARLCTAASVQDNLLFGRIAQDRAGAERQVHRVMRQVLTDQGLDDDVFRIGLDRTLDPDGDDVTSVVIAAIDLVRCLVRDPDVVVAEHALDGLAEREADALAARLRRHLAGRGLVIAAPSLSPAADTPPFDLVARFRRGAIEVEDRMVGAQAVAPEP